MNERSTSSGLGFVDVVSRAYPTHAALRAIFAITAFLSSALIFTLEPMFAKMLLPLLGGAPAVWNTCVVFFQAALLCAYGYAHVLTTRLPYRQQAITHGALVLLACLALPVAVPASWSPPVDKAPFVWLLIVLSAGLGGPFVVVSATAPLLQKWFAGTDDRAASDPYFLYSASNAGSLAALAAYPFLVEPSWSLPQQSSIWTVGYVVFGGLMLVCAAMSIRAAAASGDGVPAVPAGIERVASPGWGQRGMWLLQSLVPSSLLLGVTAYISTDVASVPLLWVLPLALDLLSFAWAFAPAPLLPVGSLSRGMPLLMSVLVLVIAARISSPVWIVIPLHLLTFFACALRLHITLADSRPHSRHLTDFYLCLAVGGVLGGALNTFLVPSLFTGIVEYPAALVAACLLQGRSAGSADRRVRRADFILSLLPGAAMMAVMYGASAYALRWTTVIALVAPLAVWCFSFSRRPLRFGLAVGTILAVAHLYTPQAHALVFASRTFFGVLRVRAHGSEHVLWHGSTIHGQQDRAAGRRGEPLTYYHRSGPIGQVMDSLSARLHGARIGVVGLGAGSLAAYAKPDQRWTFYEIDPEMLRVARDPALFTYLHDCAAACDVVLGDARLSLARADTPTYRLLVLDAFSSDAIPVHLVTREALDLYLRRLEPDGVIAFHISNRHLNLRPVFAALAADKGLAALSTNDKQPDERLHRGRFPSEWLVMARDAKAFGALAANPLWRRPPLRSATRVWTDDYSDILAVLGKR